jgi:hypothetical protein
MFFFYGNDGACLMVFTFLTVKIVKAINSFSSNFYFLIRVWCFVFSQLNSHNLVKCLEVNNYC